MSIYESVTQEISIRRWVFWYLTPGVKLQLARANDPIELVDWMTYNVGRCGYDWDWDWLLEYINDISVGNVNVYYSIKLRKNRSHLKSLILLRFTT